MSDSFNCPARETASGEARRVPMPRAKSRKYAGFCRPEPSLVARGFKYPRKMALSLVIPRLHAMLELIIKNDCFG